MLIIIACPVLSNAQEFEWIPGGTYDPSILTPESVLGYEIGEYLTDHHRMIEHNHKLAESSEMAEITKNRDTENSLIPAEFFVA